MVSYNIVIFNYREFNVNIGGIERISISLAKCLIEKGINVYLVAVYKSKYSIPYKTPVPIIFLPSNVTNSTENVSTLHTILIKNNIDIVLNQDSHSLSSHDLCHSAVNGTSTKLISALHFCPSQRLLLYKYPFDLRFFSIKENIIRGFKSLAYKYPCSCYTLNDLRYHFHKMYEESERVVLLSNYFIDEYVGIGNLSESRKLVSINNMLSFPYSEVDIKKEKRIMFCARMALQKRPERALFVWSQLQKDLPDWCMDFVGDGELLSRLKALSKELGLKNIEFHGFKDPKDFFQKSRIFLLTSDYEGWGLTITEAMQNKCVPVIMDTFASAKEIVDDGENGFLVTKCNCSEMAKRVYQLASNEHLWNAMSEAAFRKVEKFIPEAITERWLKLFAEIQKG